MSSSLVQYVVVRKDLLTSLNWPVGALIAQACHAVTAVVHLHYKDEFTQNYLSDIDNMHKVVLEAPDEDGIKNLHEVLEQNSIHHKLWIEQPENIPTCVAVKPWRKIIKDNKEQWVGVYKDHVWFLKQSDDYLFYKVYGKKSVKRQKIDENYYDDLLKDYFRLSVDIRKLYKHWCKQDPIFEKAAKHFYGIRMIKQDPVESLFSYICSQNNNISRISFMVEKLCELYGDKIDEIDNVIYYTFPAVDRLAGPTVESDLKKESFGYRAKYISQSAQRIMKFGGPEWFEKLKTMSYLEAKKALCQLPGIGAKVADCICLMSLNHLNAIPVDTHVYKIATTYYLPHLAGKKNVTDKIYSDIGNCFRELFGELAGWAHTVLFCSDLKNLQAEMNNN